MEQLIDTVRNEMKMFEAMLFASQLNKILEQPERTINNIKDEKVFFDKADSILKTVGIVAKNPLDFAVGLYKVFGTECDAQPDIISEEEIKTEIAEDNRKPFVIGEVDTSQLSPGMEIKNYRDLCAKVNEPVLEGNSKKAQIEKFERYFELIKVKGSQKYIIGEIYDEPLAKKDGRSKGNRGIYIKYIEVILLNYLSNKEGYSCTFKKHQLWELLGMVNQRYGKVKPKDLECIDYAITPFEIMHFYQRCNSRLNTILFDSLNNLKRRKVVDYQEQTIIVDAKGRYHQATDEEISKIMSVEKSVLNSMGFSSVVQVFLRFRGDEYYKQVNRLLLERYGWRYTFHQYKLIYNHSDVVAEIPKLENEMKQELNSLIATNLEASAENYYNKLFAQTGFHLPETYCIAQKLLIDELIRIKPKKNRVYTYEDRMNEFDMVFNLYHGY